MYDEYGNYKFGLAEVRRRDFVAQFGSDALKYIQEYSTSRWDEPAEMRALREAREILRPYWQVQDTVWAGQPQLQQISQQIILMERTDPKGAKRLLLQYPQILFLRKRTALIRQQMKARDPVMKRALDLFYSY